MLRTKHHLAINFCLKFSSSPAQANPRSAEEHLTAMTRCLGKDQRSTNQLSITDAEQTGPRMEIFEILGNSDSRTNFHAEAEKVLNEVNRVGRKTLVAVVLSVIGCAAGIPALCLQVSSKVWFSEPHQSVKLFDVFV